MGDHRLYSTKALIPLVGPVALNQRTQGSSPCAPSILLLKDRSKIWALGTTSSLSSTATTMTCYRYPFATPVTLLASQPYLLSLSITTGGGTTALRLMSNAAGTATMWWLNAPGTTLSGSPQYNTIGLSPG
jgi:hypothetical protein